MALEPIAALMSIRQRFANLILDGFKTVELRRIPLRRNVTHVFIYESRGAGLITGFFEVERMVLESPARLWQKYCNVSGLSKHEFDAYYAGCKIGTAIEVRRAIRLQEPIALERLNIFHPLQSFAYVGDSSFRYVVNAICDAA